jgi:FkbM family methyltransferase
MPLLNTIRFILGHPLNSNRRLAALVRFASWQVGSRLVPGPIAVDFVDGTRLLVSAGQAGATGNVYAGLHELNEMAFVLHMLREGDLFVDIGANIGSYTILAAGAAGATVIAFEPAVTAYRVLCDNVRLNDVGSFVETRNEAVGARNGEVAFTQTEDTLNRVALASEATPTGNVRLTTLDTALGARVPLVMKIDVEGFESSVIAGGSMTMGNPAVQAVIMETNGSGMRYSSTDEELHGVMEYYGFSACSYDPFTRRISPLSSPSRDGNTIYVRDVSASAKRVLSAPRYGIAGRSEL